jgi:hypothetical protein
VSPAPEPNPIGDPIEHSSRIGCAIPVWERVGIDYTPPDVPSRLLVARRSGDFRLCAGGSSAGGARGDSCAGYCCLVQRCPKCFGFIGSFNAAGAKCPIDGEL